jgi:hypothetical protein
MIQSLLFRLGLLRCWFQNMVIALFYTAIHSCYVLSVHAHTCLLVNGRPNSLDLIYIWYSGKHSFEYYILYFSKLRFFCRACIAVRQALHALLY